MAKEKQSPQASVNTSQVPIQPTPEKAGFSRVLTGFLVILFGLLLEITIAVSFYQAAARDAIIQPSDSDSGAGGGFFATVFPTIICLILLLFLLLMIVLKNRRSSKQLFMSLGMAFVIPGGIGLVSGLLCPVTSRHLPGAMRDGLLETAPALGNLLIVIALACFVIASVFISLGLITAHKKGGASA